MSTSYEQNRRPSFFVLPFSCVDGLPVKVSELRPSDTSLSTVPVECEGRK